MGTDRRASVFYNCQNKYKLKPCTGLLRAGHTVGRIAASHCESRPTASSSYFVINMHRSRRGGPACQALISHSNSYMQAPSGHALSLFLFLRIAVQRLADFFPPNTEIFRLPVYTVYSIEPAFQSLADWRCSCKLQVCVILRRQDMVESNSYKTGLINFQVYWLQV